MRLVRTAPDLEKGGKRYFFFETYVQNPAGFGELRSTTDGELALIQQKLPRMQSMADRALGDNVGTFFIGNTLGGNYLILEVTADQGKSESVRSLIGWVELFGLENQDFAAEAKEDTSRIAFPSGSFSRGG